MQILNLSDTDALLNFTSDVFILNVCSRCSVGAALLAENNVTCTAFDLLMKHQFDCREGIIVCLHDFQLGRSETFCLLSRRFTSSE